VGFSDVLAYIQKYGTQRTDAAVTPPEERYVEPTIATTTSSPSTADRGASARDMTYGEHAPVESESRNEVRGRNCTCTEEHLILIDSPSALILTVS